MRRTDAALDAIARRTAVALSMAGVQPRRSGTSVLPGPGHYAPATIRLSGVRVTEPASRPTERGRRNTAGADTPASRRIAAQFAQTFPVRRGPPAPDLFSFNRRKKIHVIG